MSISDFNTGQFNWRFYASNIQSNVGQNLTLDSSGNTSILLRINNTNKLRITDASSIFLNILDLSGNKLVNTLSVASQNNQNITIEGMGTGDVILKTGNTDRISVLDTGVINFQGGMSYNNATNTLTATTFSGNLSGNASTATNATTATTATNATNVDINDYVGVGTLTYPVFSSTTSGNNALKIDNTGTGLKYNPQNSTLTTSTFSGDLSGNATSATSATNATNVGIATSSTNASFYPTFVSTTTGNLPPLVDSDLTYNPSTNTLTATTFSGNATSATNIAGGAGGSIPYQSALNTTALLANGSNGQVLTSNGGTSAPSWTTISTTNQYILAGNAQNVNNNNTYYFGFPLGSIASNAANNNESATQNTIPFDTTLSKWYIRLSGQAGTTTNGWTFTIRKNGGNTTLTISIIGATSTGSDLTNSVSFSAGDLFSISAVRVGAPNNVDLVWSCKGS